MQFLNPLWTEFIFTPALEGKLGQSKQDLQFFHAFLAIPDEVFKAESANAMADFIKDYMAGETQAVKNARLILLGNGGAGKTSIVNQLLAKTLKNHEKPTPRVQVRELWIEFEGKKEPLSIWDFGGQVIMQSTHSFFLSSQSTYLIACNSRANEQPDAWLKFLQRQTSSSNPLTVLLVYTHCDTHYDHIEDAPWYRGKALKRKFGKQFDLTFHQIDLDPSKKSQPYFAVIDKTIKERACIEFAKQMDKDVTAVKILLEDLEKTARPYISHQDLMVRLSEKLNKKIDSKKALFIGKLANNYGFIFPEKLIDKETKKVAPDFAWVSQKHWLTYAVYRLVNNAHVIKAGGLLSTEIMKAALEKCCIVKKTGEVEAHTDADHEVLQYDEDGIALLKRILVNYRWAFVSHKRLDQLLLPLATSLDEPDILADVSRKFSQFLSQQSLQKKSQDLDTLDKRANNTILMEVELVNKPADFFFKLVTYFDPHLSETENLWRTGAILDFYGSGDTRAILEMPDNVLSLKIMGKDKESFRQLLLISIKETLKSYEGISAHASESIELDGKSQMLSSDVISSLASDQNVVENFKKLLLERGSNMSSITNNFNAPVIGANVGGGREGVYNGNTEISNVSNNINVTGKELIEVLQKLSTELPKAEASAVDESITAIQEAVNEPDEAKKKSLLKKGVDLVKDLAVLDKGVDLVAEYSAEAMEHIPALGDLVNKLI